MQQGISSVSSEMLDAFPDPLIFFAQRRVIEVEIKAENKIWRLLTIGVKDVIPEHPDPSTDLWIRILQSNT